MDISAIIYFIAQCMPGFLLAVVAHEASHGMMALYFGDDTAKRMGRLTLNPVVHADLVGTIIIPVVGIAMSVMGMFFPVIGWANPVPVDYRNFKNYKKGVFWTSFAGPLANFFLGILSAFLLAIVAHSEGELGGYKNIFIGMLNYSVMINFVLGFFNLIPLPPLDGSNMLSVFLSYQANQKYREIAQYSNMILWGLVLLAMAGVPVFKSLFMPPQYLSQFFTNLFLLILN